MRRDDQGGRGRFTAGAALRREAIAERPPFSEAFHKSLVRRLPTARPPRQARRAVLAAEVPPTRVRRTLIPLAVSAALVAVAVLLVARPVRDAEPARPLGPMNADGAVVVALDAATSSDLGVAAALPEETPGIDRLPTPGEIEEELREGVTTLAVSLLDVPEWTALADFDAGALLGEGGR